MLWCTKENGRKKKRERRKEKKKKEETWFTGREEAVHSLLCVGGTYCRAVASSVWKKA